MTTTNLADFAYFRLIYGWMQGRINGLSEQMVQHTVQWITSFALVLVTLWVLLRGYRLVTGQVRESAMTVVSHMIRIALVVTFATTVSLINNDLRTFVTQDMSNTINYMVNGSASSMTATIDENLAYTQLVMAAIDSVQVSYDDGSAAREKSRAMLIATLGTAGPPMTAGAMLLLYQIAMALILGLAPLFILCLVFDQTRGLFRRWAMFTVSTLFSMAALNAMIAIALKATINTAEALWAVQAVIHITSASAEGFNSLALQQAGVGLLMTVLIISVPPMAAALFNGALGSFMPFVGFGAGRQERRATEYPQGQASGVSDTNILSDVAAAGRLINAAPAAQPDMVKTFSAPDDLAMADAAYGDPRYWTAQVGTPAPGTGTLVSSPSSPSVQQMSDRGINMLKRAEGSLRLRPYDDQTGLDIDHWVVGATIGYGHLIPQDRWTRFSSGLTEGQANELFESDLQPFIDTVNASLSREVSQNQFDALVILCFNIGQGAFQQSSALRLINDPQATTTYGSIDDAWRAWNRSQGRVNRGLDNRRSAELDLYNNGNYGE